ncbi:hypothetical protein T439DRAFT_30640 [Meredithblackwellia eburnea MCA 4105]
MPGGPPPFVDAFGPIILGAMFAMYFSGHVTSQAADYFQRYPYGKDRKVFFFAVWALVVVDIFGSLCAIYSAYLFGVKYWGDVTKLGRGPWSLGFNPPVTGVCSLIVQSFYAYRVWVVSSKNRILPAIIMFLATVSFAFSLGGPWLVLKHGFADYAKAYNWGIQLWLAPAAAGDMVITASIIFYLRKVSNNSGFAETSTMMRMIMRSTLENNSVTAVLALLDLLLFSLSTTNWHLFTALSLPKLYIISFLTSLNGRSRILETASGATTRRTSVLPSGLHSIGPLTSGTGIKVDLVRGGVGSQVRDPHFDEEAQVDVETKSRVCFAETEKEKNEPERDFSAV